MIGLGGGLVLALAWLFAFGLTGNAGLAWPLAALVLAVGRLDPIEVALLIVPTLWLAALFGAESPVLVMVPVALAFVAVHVAIEGAGALPARGIGLAVAVVAMAVCGMRFGTALSTGVQAALWAGAVWSLPKIWKSIRARPEGWRRATA